MTFVQFTDLWSLKFLKRIINFVIPFGEINLLKTKQRSG